jgi:hypothetical protein
VIGEETVERKVHGRLLMILIFSCAERAGKPQTQGL